MRKAFVYFTMCAIAVGSFACASKTGTTTAAKGASTKEAPKAETATAKSATTTAPTTTENVDGLQIFETAVCKNVEDRNPVSSGTEFPANIGQLYFFTKIGLTTPDQKGTIKHVWHFAGKEVANIQLPVEGESWRTYSQKTIDPSQKGEWRVDLMSGTNKVLKSVAFTVK